MIVQITNTTNTITTEYNGNQGDKCQLVQSQTSFHKKVLIALELAWINNTPNVLALIVLINLLGLISKFLK